MEFALISVAEVTVQHAIRIYKIDFLFLKDNLINENSEFWNYFSNIYNSVQSDFHSISL